MKKSKYNFLEFTTHILEKTGEPLTIMEIWEKSSEFYQRKEMPDGGYEVWNEDENNLLLTTGGKTPWLTISAKIYSDMKKNPETTQFSKIGKPPNIKFYLKNKATNTKHSRKSSKTKSSTEKTEWDEGDLHPLLTYFAYKKLGGIRTKTIDHNSSGIKDGWGEWLHPDLVGLYMPSKWGPAIKELAKTVSGSNVIKLYSFEVKQFLSKANYRASFFQAVSNSSWANEGYLVAANIKQDDQIFSSELKRLTSSFGIGIINLDLANFDSSSILYPATFKPDIDWETVNKLHSKENGDFEKFITVVRDSLGSAKKSIIESGWDNLIDSPQKYIKKKKMK